MRKALILLILILLVSGCTTQQIPDTERPVQDNITNETTQENITTPQTNKTEPLETDNTTEPENHTEENKTLPPDPCTNITCAPITLGCPDGFVTGCQPVCKNGTCVPCTPDCSGHTCVPDWTCSGWSSCEDSLQTRTCWDQNECGTDLGEPEETQACEPAPNHILFTRIMYDTPGKESAQEWLELFNPTETLVDLSGWAISDNSGTWTIPNGTGIDPDTELVIARNQTGFADLYGCAPDLAGLTRGLNNDGDQLLLKDSTGKEIDQVAWENFLDGWSLAASEGKAIKRTHLEDTDSPDDWLSEQEIEMCS